MPWDFFEEQLDHLAATKWMVARNEAAATLQETREVLHFWVKEEWEWDFS